MLYICRVRRPVKFTFIAAYGGICTILVFHRFFTYAVYNSCD